MTRRFKSELERGGASDRQPETKTARRKLEAGYSCPMPNSDMHINRGESLRCNF